jgi:fluoroacetyl-CoA thioesterase
VKPTLRPGLSHRLRFEVPASKTVPHLYPESAEFRAMPEVFATGFMVGLMEWACMEAIAPHLDPGEGSLGVHVNFSHLAATPPGLTITVDCEITAVDGKSVVFKVRGHDGVDLIGEGEHHRAVVNYERFNARAADKASKARAA